jgi:tRNA-dihydrouridine synthase C
VRGVGGLYTARTMTLLLAPMEGLLDFTLRDVLTRVGGIDRCVSEFIRVSGTLLPDRAFVRIVPELLNGSRTPAGVPVRAQLMGSDDVCLAENAAKLAALGPEGIDLNFGCPAKVVNRHGGGAALLAEPERVGRIVAAVRRAVPAHLPVSAKMRLGVDHPHWAVACAQAMVAGGACELVVHARTKLDGYRPPAYWEHVHAIREAVPVPVVANGEVWTAQDAARCREVSGCEALMLGRGMVRDPGLALAIAHPGQAPQRWQELLPLLKLFWGLVGEHIAEPRHRAGRLKQWLHHLRHRHGQAEEAYQRVRTLNDPAAVSRVLFGPDQLGAERSADEVAAWAHDGDLNKRTGVVVAGAE